MRICTGQRQNLQKIIIMVQAENVCTFFICGNIGGSTIKLGRRIKELERIYGVREGRPEKTSSNGTSLTQQELANQLGIDINTLKRAKTLTNLSPEIQELVENGSVSACTFILVRPFFGQSCFLVSVCITVDRFS